MSQPFPNAHCKNEENDAWHKQSKPTPTKVVNAEDSAKSLVHREHTEDGVDSLRYPIRVSISSFARVSRDQEQSYSVNNGVTDIHKENGKVVAPDSATE